MTELEQFRAQKDQFFQTHNQSPLTSEQKQDFTGLNYFPENPELRLEATIEVFPEQISVEMQTTTGGTQFYMRFGRFSFTVDGQEVALTLYSNGQDFFLPFADALAGTETYPAGRYLEPEAGADGTVLVDFNLAYNPYCAYNDAWSCPITPPENRLRVPIRAGERLFDHE